MALPDGTISTEGSNELPVDVTDHGRKRMEEEGGDLVQAVEYQAVAPDDDGQADWAHTQNVVGEEPARMRPDNYRT